MRTQKASRNNSTIKQTEEKSLKSKRGVVVLSGALIFYIRLLTTEAFMARKHKQTNKQKQKRCRTHQLSFFWVRWHDMPFPKWRQNNNKQI
jgi:ABC-type transporter Mla maintaining outer membrane lipid asymmetry ATPase subunit MlaF